MASACCPGDVLQASEGKTRFVRLARLLVCGGTTVMRELFDYITPPANLAAVLSSPPVKLRLKDMKTKRILTSPQWQKLYPLSGAGSVQSTFFDITLLFKLLRENMISGLSAPSTGWDELPNIGDLSLPADMARIKYYRNGIAHGDEKMELSEQEFSDYWQEIKDALMRIVGQYATSGSSTVRDWEMAIYRLLNDPLTEDDRKNVEELKSWYLEEKDLKQLVHEMKGVFQSHFERDLQEQKSKSKEFVVRCVVRIAGVGAWLGGTIFVLNLLKDNPEVLIEYVKYSIIPTGLAIVSFAFGSIKITMRAETVDALDKIVKRYNTGQLKEDFEKVLITGELKNLANGERLELSVKINEEELMEIRKLLVEEEACNTSAKSFCTLPPKPSHQIINRLDDVKGLLEKIEHKTTNEITVAYLCGKPGCGKSELARQLGETFYINIAGQTTGAKFVFTFNASSIETLIHSYIEFIRILGFPKDSIAMVVTAKDASLEEKIMKLKDLAAPKLEKYSSWLMIVDNVRDLELVSRFFPTKKEKTSGNGQVLVTTQDNQAMALDSKCTFFFSINAGMRTVDANKTLKEISTFSTEQAIISEVAKALNFQPLALACAAIYMRNVCSRESSMTWTRFLEEHEAKAAAETDVNPDLTYPASMKAAVIMALEKEMSDSILMLAFQFLSVMAPEPILLEYVVQYVKTCKPDANDQVVAERVSSSSLVRISAEGSSVSVHQVVHDCLQTVMSQHKEIDIAFQELLKMLKAFPLLGSYNTEDNEHIFATSSLLIHFLAFTRKLQHYVEESLSTEMLLEMFSDNNNTANSLSLVGNICCTYGHYIASDMCSEISSTLKERMLVKNDPRLAAMMKKLAFIYYLKLRQHQVATKCFERALAIEEKAYGDGDHRLATTLNEMGVIHRDLGQHKEAKTCFERALGIQEKAYGHDDPPRLVSTLNELGVSHRDLGQHEEAVKCFKRALAIQEKANGDDDPRLAAMLNEIGVSHRDLGQHQEAVKCFKRALAIQEKAHGHDVPRLVSELNRIGLYHRDLQQHQEATKCFERALAIQEKAYGHDDPRLVPTLNELGVSHRDLKQHQEAVKCFERALVIEEKAYGHDDPRLVPTLNEMGISHRDLGQQKEAMKCFERTLAIQEKAYGHDVPRLVSELNKLGLYHRDLGQHKEATKCFERALAIQEKAYGHDDPRLVPTLNELGVSHRDLKQHQEAVKCFERALVIEEKAYGHDDPRLVPTLNEMGISHRDLGQQKEAMKCFERTLAIQEKAYGHDVPLLVRELNKLGFYHRNIQQHQEATKCFEKVLTIEEKAYGHDDPRLATTLDEMGFTHRDLGQHQEAVKCFKRSLAIEEIAYGDDDSLYLVPTLNELVVSHRELKQHQEAVKCFERALAIQEKAYGHDDPRLVSELNKLGLYHRDLQQHQEATKCFEKVMTIQEKMYGHDDPRLVSTLKEVGRYHRDLGQYQEATKCFDHALSILETTYSYDELLLGSTHEEAKPTVIASASGPGDVLRPSEDKTRFVRLPRLMLHV